MARNKNKNGKKTQVTESEKNDWTSASILLSIITVVIFAVWVLHIYEYTLISVPWYAIFLIIIGILTAPLIIEFRTKKHKKPLQHLAFSTGLWLIMTPFFINYYFADWDNCYTNKTYDIVDSGQIRGRKHRFIKRLFSTDKRGYYFQFMLDSNCKEINVRYKDYPEEVLKAKRLTLQLHRGALGMDVIDERVLFN